MVDYKWVFGTDVIPQSDLKHQKLRDWGEKAST